MALSWDAHNELCWNSQWSSQPELAVRCGVFIGGDPEGEKTIVTWGKIVTRVSNGRILFSGATLLKEQVKLTYRPSIHSKPFDAIRFLLPSWFSFDLSNFFVTFGLN